MDGQDLDESHQKSCASGPVMGGGGGTLTYKDECVQGRIQDLIGGGPDRDRPKTAILGPRFCRILVLGPHFWWSGGAAPGSAPGVCEVARTLMHCRTFTGPVASQDMYFSA